MKTIFLILNYKTYNDTIRLTKSLLRNELNDRLIVVVDNASPNESLEVLTDVFQNEKKVEVISSPKNEGYAKGNNYGLNYIRKYNPEYVCIINNDVYFDFSVIKKLEDLYASIPKIAFLVPVQYNLDNQPVSFVDFRKIPTLWDDLKVTMGFSGSRHVYNNEIAEYGLQKIEIALGAFLFISYPLFQKLGFFYEGTFLFCEERFMAKKIKDSHLNSYLLLNEHYIHAHSVTINSETSKKQQRRLLFNGKILYTKKYRNFSILKIGLLYAAFYLFIPLEGIRHWLCKLRVPFRVN